MCGIVGYVGNRPAAPILLEALRRLEYRGYDSAGMATVSGRLVVRKDRGRIADIDRKLKLVEMPGKVGVGHTRWATHGEPSQVNAHPHVDNAGKIAVVHNGIIENYLEIKKFLQDHGFRFVSKTDTEVVPHLISFFLNKGGNLEESVRRAARRLRGSFALAVISAEEPDKIIAVRQDSPLILGLGSGEIFLASDIPAMLQHTNRVLILENGEMAVLTSDRVVIRKFGSGAEVRREPMVVKWTAEMAEKGGYPHFTLKEIFQQPEAVQDTLRAPPEELRRLAKFLTNARRVYFVACGTSYHAALVAKYALAKLAGFPVEVVISSEFGEIGSVDGKTAVLAITQSGETADTLKAVEAARAAGARVACLTNVVGSSITRMSDLVCCTHAGPEVSVVATKTFAAQVAYLLRLAVEVAAARGRSGPRCRRLASGLKSLPEIMRKNLAELDPRVRRLASRLLRAEHIYLIGRGIGYPLVLEGALKLKEITYIHSEGMPAGELKHGTLALIEEGTPVIAVVPPGGSRVKIVSNVEEVKARGAHVVAIADNGKDLEGHVDELISIPHTEELFSPLLFIIPLQLLAYHITVARGQDPDRPRSLAKSVTVE
ncbi:MAG: glutamine--fructose-6-phosphate transaminase (isomerizing) [Candidatus Hadarchaeum sp.]|uniref:glutamine--fructose-6-phosphate transaminase (isomerizing) n=1 Tax=Candidatus Hadarchaeum sp. TaxID=2883567 RepID=UPI003D0D6C67